MKYNKNIEDTILGLLAVIIVFTVIFGICFGINFLLAKAVIWVVAGVFNYDLSDKFWHVFVGLMLLSFFFKPNINVKVNKK